MQETKVPQPPQPPQWLQGPALDKWNQLWRLLDPARVKPELHSDTVLLYCQAYRSLCETSEHINRFGFYVREGDRVVPNPRLAERDGATRTMIDLAKALGISPDIGRVTWPDMQAPAVPPSPRKRKRKPRAAQRRRKPESK